MSVCGRGGGGGGGGVHFIRCLFSSALFLCKSCKYLKEVVA